MSEVNLENEVLPVEVHWKILLKYLESQITGRGRKFVFEWEVIKNYRIPGRSVKECDTSTLAALKTLIDNNLIDISIGSRDGRVGRCISLFKKETIAEEVEKGQQVDS